MTALPLRILQILVVGLALHNIVMAHLWEAGVRGRALDAVSAWKELLLLVAAGAAVVAVVRLRRPLRFVAADWLALGYALVVERELLRGYVDAARALPHALRRRRTIQPRRRATPPFGLVPPRD